MLIIYFSEIGREVTAQQVSLRPPLPRGYGPPRLPSGLCGPTPHGAPPQHIPHPPTDPTILRGPAASRRGAGVRL